MPPIQEYEQCNELSRFVCRFSWLFCSCIKAEGPGMEIKNRSSAFFPFCRFYCRFYFHFYCPFWLPFCRPTSSHAIVGLSEQLNLCPGPEPPGAGEWTNANFRRSVHCIRPAIYRVFTVKLTEEFSSLLPVFGLYLQENESRNRRN